MSGSQPLDNQQHEQFAHLVSQGVAAKNAYIQAGYGGASAQTSASRLSKHDKVAARIAHLRAEAANAVIAKAMVDREWVLGGIKRIAESNAAKDADRLRAFELIGKELGMFVQRVGDPDGASLTDKIEVEFVDASGEVGEGVPAAHTA